ncbi:transposase [Hymenobacter sp. BRD67]|uniref:transposase n=1 Tax=Hymenobacter sp. BRD67 TaxID=2675877 RepID=UPI0015652BE0|nr:transposase [Hymenobacter sp. BRD67]QKG55154.1 transposase [Hymenobacter sp. BRD67]
MQALETELLTLLETRFSREMTLLRSIPGIGRKTAGLLLLFAGGFTRLDNYRQLIAKAGLSPASTLPAPACGAKSVSRRWRRLDSRQTLYVQLRRIKFNAACKALYDRLVAKGKNGKVALIAVCNKLLKQAFAIVKSGVPYHADFTKNFA